MATKRKMIKMTSSGGKGHSNAALVELDPKFRKFAEHMDACCARNREVCDTGKCDRWFDSYVDARGIEVDWDDCMEQFNDRRPGWMLLEVGSEEGDNQRDRDPSHAR